MSILTNDIDKLTNVLFGDKYIVLPTTDYEKYYQSHRYPSMPSNYPIWFTERWRNANLDRILTEIKSLVNDDWRTNYVMIQSIIKHHFRGPGFTFGRQLGDNCLSQIDVWWDYSKFGGSIAIRIPVLSLKFIEIID